MNESPAHPPLSLMLGRRITAPGDQLDRIDAARVFRGIAQPKPAFRDRIDQLRTIATVDARKYRELKKSLPYLVCSHFHPNIRRKEHFAQTTCFMLDLDHLSEAGLGISEVREKLRSAPAPVLGFASPSGNGFKVLLRLSVPCRDAARFHAFYQNFARQFAHELGLEKVVDYQTCDVTRACFMSYDPEAFYRPQAPPVEMSSYLNGGAFSTVAEPKKKRAADEKAPPATKRAKTGSPDVDTLAQIRQKLNPGRRKKPNSPAAIQPEEIKEALAYFEQHLSEYDLRLDKSAAINYGRKLRIGTNGNLWCEINLFYGRRGFSIVKTTKSGSNTELADLAAQVLSELLHDRFDNLDS